MGESRHSENALPYLAATRAGKKKSPTEVGLWSEKV